MGLKLRLASKPTLKGFTMQLNKKLAALGATLSIAGGNAFAAVPAEVTASLTEAKADSLVVAGLALVIIIAIAAFKFMRRAV